MLKFSPIFNKKDIQGYTEQQNADKVKFHKESKKLLKAIADILNITDYDLRSNMAGPAVSGEITLHSDNLYLQLSCNGFNGETSILYRSCNGKKDYTGGQNNFITVARLKDSTGMTQFFKNCTQLMKL